MNSSLHFHLSFITHEGKPVLSCLGCGSAPDKQKRFLHPKTARNRRCAHAQAAGEVSWTQPFKGVLILLLRHAIHATPTVTHEEARSLFDYVRKEQMPDHWLYHILDIQGKDEAKLVFQTHANGQVDLLDLETSVTVERDGKPISRKTDVEQLIHSLAFDGLFDTPSVLDLDVLYQLPHAEPAEDWLKVSERAAPLPVNTRVRLQLRQSLPAYPLVFWIDAEGEALPLHPFEELPVDDTVHQETRNQQAKPDFILPGTAKRDYWELSAPLGWQTVVAFASAQTWTVERMRQLRTQLALGRTHQTDDSIHSPRFGALVPAGKPDPMGLKSLRRPILIAHDKEHPADARHHAIAEALLEGSDPSARVFTFHCK